jgi:SAM-dependent methyltransferase
MQSTVKAIGHTKAKALELVSRHVPAGEKVLELSCGEGILADAMLRSGYQVRGSNYSVYPQRNPAVPVDTGVDLLEPLPYPDASFDCVVLSEVLQNVPDHRFVLGEVARVLRPGGVFVLTTPNMMNVKSRLHFLFTGYFKVKWMFIGHDVPLGQAFAFHNHPVHLPVLLYYLSALGFAKPLVDGIYVKPKSVLLTAFFGWLIKPLTWFNVTRAEKNLRHSGASRQHYEALTGFMALTADRLAVVARKGEARPSQPSVSDVPEWAQTYRQ